MKQKTFIPMTMWAAEDIPSNKILNSNPQELSNAELLSIIIGTGSCNETAVELARRILVESENSLSKLSKLSSDKLKNITGIGRQKAAKILSAFELGRRRQNETASERPDLATATRIYNYMLQKMMDLDVEEFWLLLMNQNFRLIKSERISQGGITEVNVDIRIIMREAVLNNATIIAVCHNHPSGNIRPSRIDDTLTLSVKKACEVMRIHFCDHVIVTDGSYYSYHEQGKL